MAVRVPESQTDLRDYVRVLRRRWISVALTTGVVLLAALAYSLLSEPTYTATATVLVPEAQANAAMQSQSSGAQNPTALERSLSDDQEFATGDAVRDAATRALGHPADVRVGESNSSDILTFTAHSATKADAPHIANAYAQAFIDERRANQVDQYTQQISALQGSIAKLQARQAALPASSPQRTALAQSIATLTQTIDQTQAATELATQIGPTVIAKAAAPMSPSSPKVVRNVVLGILTGLFLGVVLVFARDRFDDRIHSLAEAEQAANGRSVVALLPFVSDWESRESRHLALAEDPASGVAEAYRTARTAIQFMGIGKPAKLLAVTSALPDEGKTTTVANLALSFARAGASVIVVSCDLRRPRLHEFFGVSNDRGLTSVLLGEVEIEDVLSKPTDESQLFVLPSGPVPPNPAELLSLEGTRRIITDLASRADIVLLDCPPVLPVADALIVSQWCDGILVLASANATSTRRLGRTLDLLDQVNAPVMGLLLNRVPFDAQSYQYEYGTYGYSNVAPNHAPIRGSYSKQDPAGSPVPVQAQDAAIVGQPNE